MPLETATYINELEPSNPAGTDQLAQGDDHLRLIKAALQATFPNITGPVTKTQTELNEAGFSMPIGSVIVWYGIEADIPSGWVLCNGQTVPRSDSAGNITAPNLIDRVVIGAGTTAAQGATAGATTASATTGSAGDHVHTISGGAHTHTASETQATSGQTLTTTTAKFDPSNAGNAAVTSASLTAASAHSHTVTVDSATHSHTMDTLGAHSHSVSVSTIQPVLGLHYIMKY